MENPVKRYTFSCYDEGDRCETTISFETESDTWSGYDGPVWKFFEFLKGCGFVFHHNAEIGVMDDDGEFNSASE